MNAVIVYESMFGGTRQVAEALARGIGRHATVTVVNVNEAGDRFPDADLVLVGGPTHVHSFTSPATRAEAVKWTEDPARKLALESGAPGIGIREWIAALTNTPRNFVAFDTRADIAEFLSGSAAKHIQKALKRAGGHAQSEPLSFLVHDDQVTRGELHRAEKVGEELASQLAQPAGEAASTSK